MADIIKYDMTNIWASAGDVVAPDAAKINAGWGVEVVPRQWWNWFENRQDNNIAYMLQKGFPEWDATTQYIINKSYVQRNGIVYKATATSTNSDPVNLTSWVRAFTDYTVANAALGTITPAADRLPYFNGASTATFTTLTAFARTLLDDTTNTAARTTLGAQASHTNLTALSGVTAAANALPYFTSTTAMGVATLTAFGRSLMDDNDATAARDTLGLGTAALGTLTVNTTTGTFGQVLRVGDFGLGQFAPGSTTDLDDITSCSWRAIDSGTANVPVGASSGSTCFTSVYNTDNIQQTVFGRNTNQVWRRRKTPSGWQPWFEDWNTTNLVKTTSAIDSTAGSMLKVGDFGLGSYCIPVTGPQIDSPTALKTGFYEVSGSQTWANRPAGAEGQYSRLLHIVHNNVAGYWTQTLWVFSHTAPRQFFRTMQGGILGAWVELYHTGNSSSLADQVEADVVATLQPQIDEKITASSYKVSSAFDTDPDTLVADSLLIRHANCPTAGQYYYVEQIYYSTKGANSNRSQIARSYNGSVPTLWIRHKYTDGGASVGGWSPWVRCDGGGNAATATALQTARTINGVSFNGTANINVPVYAAPGSVSEIGKYLDFHETGSVADADVRLMSVPAGGTAPTPGYTGAGLAVGVGTSAGNGSVYAAQFVTNGGWFRSNGNLGWYNETYAGGIYMTDNTWVRTYNGKGFHADGGLSTSGGLYVGGVITGNGSGLTNVVSVPTEIVRNSSIVEFSGIYLTGANVSTCDVPDPYVMVGMRTGANGPHGWAWLRATTFRTRA